MARKRKLTVAEAKKTGKANLIADAKEQEKKLALEFYVGGGPSPKHEDLKSIELGDCGACGKPVFASEARREDPLHSGTFFHMHGCFAKSQDRLADRLKKREVEPSGNFDPQTGKIHPQGA